MAKNAVERVIYEDPDQMFFDFYTPPAAPAGAHAHAAASGGRGRGRQAQTASPARHMIIAQRAEAPAAPALHAPPRMPAISARPAERGAQAFLTESRAAELVMQAARECGAGEVKRARVVFKPFRATLYSYRVRRGGAATVKFHVAFRGAPETVVTQAARLMLTRRRRDRRALERSAYDAFVRSLPPSDFELPGARRGHRVSICGPGRHQSLEESFRRVNAEYFQSRIEPPELCWSKERARRILGSYQERNDRVIISRMFDRAETPPYIIDYLMYHELLHKFLGIGRRDSGKRLLHGADFRRLERQFRFYKEAQEYLRTRL